MHVVMVCLFWIVFCIMGSLLVLKQMTVVSNEQAFGEEYSENLEFAWLSFWIVTCLVVPLFAIGGNFIQWFVYRHWLLKGGSIVTNPSKVPPKRVQPEDLHNDEEGGFSIFS